MCSAWMNFMLSPVDFAETYVSVVSRNGSTSTSHGGDSEPSSQPPSREQIPLASERCILSVRRARKKLRKKSFEVTFSARLFSRFTAYGQISATVQLPKYLCPNNIWRHFCSYIPAQLC